MDEEAKEKREGKIHDRNENTTQLLLNPNIILTDYSTAWKAYNAMSQNQPASWFCFQGRQLAFTKFLSTQTYPSKMWTKL